MIILTFIFSCVSRNEDVFQLVIGVATSLIIFLLISAKSRISNWIKLRRFVRHYEGFEAISGEKHDNKVYSFKYCILNNRIILTQKSNARGSWSSSLLIDTANPYLSMGTYSYLDCGKYSGDWGTMIIWLNKSNTEIVVESSPKNREGKGIAKFILRKKTEKLPN